MITFVGPLSAKTIGGNDFFATFTIGMFVIGTAVCNLPSTVLFNKYGRRGGFAIGCFCLILGAIMCAIGISGSSLGLLISGSCIMGLGVGMGQFYRFAAIDIASEEHKSWAVTTVLTGGCFAAFLGPTLGIASRDIFAKQYVGCYLMMVLLGVVNLATVLLVKFPPPITPDAHLIPDALASLSSSFGAGGHRLSHDSVNSHHSHASHHSKHRMTSGHENPEVLMHGLNASDSAAPAAPLTNPIGGSDAGEARRSVSDTAGKMKARPLLGIVLSVGFIVPTLINTLSQVLMMIVMINCTLELNNLGYSFVIESLVLDMHFFAMFASGFITGYLIKQYKCFYVCVAGSILLGIAYVIFLSGEHLANFFVGDILLGISWNMLFSAGTVMLSNCYEPIEQNAIQSINEFIINAISGIFSIASGVILATYGWHTVVLSLFVVYLIAVASAIAGCLYYKAHYGNINDYNATFQSRPGSINSSSSAHVHAIKSALAKGPDVNSILHQETASAKGNSSDDELLRENASHAA